MAEDKKGPGGRPRLFPDPEAFAEKADAYFKALEGSGKPPTMAGLCLFMGFDDRDSFTRYETYGDAFSRTVKRARLRIEADRNERLLDRQDFTAGVIFDLKNNHGWKDKVAHVGGGEDEPPIRHDVDLSHLSIEDLDALLAIQSRLAGVVEHAIECPESGTTEEG